MAGLVAVLALSSVAVAQVLPEGASGVPSFTCPARDQPLPPPDTESERLEQERRMRYREVFPAYLSMVGGEPDPILLMPIPQVSVARVADTWGGPRDGGRLHEGQDIFAPAGTPILPAAPGYVYRIGPNPRGGNVVVVVAAGGHRHYYAHLSEFGDIREGQYVDLNTILGYVGNTGNAVTTPPHLHFGLYVGADDDVCSWRAVDPLPLLRDRQP